MDIISSLYSSRNVVYPSSISLGLKYLDGTITLRAELFTLIDIESLINRLDFHSVYTVTIYTKAHRFFS